MLSAQSPDSEFFAEISAYSHPWEKELAPFMDVVDVVLNS